MANTTYSFSDINMVINPSIGGATSTNGQGLGSVTIEYANDNSSHDLAADGSVMVNKIKANNGTVSIKVQQTSPLNAYFLGLWTALDAAPTAFWAANDIEIGSLLNLANGHSLTGVSFQKRAGQPYEQQGQQVTWNLLFASGVSFGSMLSNLANISAQGIQAPVLSTSATVL